MGRAISDTSRKEIVPSPIMAFAIFTLAFCILVCLQLSSAEYSKENLYAKEYQHLKRDNDDDDDDNDRGSGNANGGCPVEFIKNSSLTWINFFNSGAISTIARFHDRKEAIVQAPGMGGALTVGRDDIEQLFYNVFLSGVKLRHLFKTVYCPCPKSFVEVTIMELTFPMGTPITTFNVNQGRIENRGRRAEVVYEYNNFGSN